MQNSTRFLDLSTDPKLQLLNRLIKECFRGNVTHNTQLASVHPTGNVPWCPRTFDGFACWDETPPDSTVLQPCPDFVVGFDSRRFAYKTCTENGTWFTHPQAASPWTNYTSCVDMEDLNFRNVVNNIYIGGYSISVAALLLSIFVFIYFRTLQCTRIRIHIHLFTSFALNNILWIVWYKTVVNNVTVVQNNEDWCQVLHIITNYFMVTSYIWMFCEGLHLHIALVVVFVKDEVAMRWFVCLGWGLPLVIVVVYAIVRYQLPGATDRCWMDQSDAFWIITIPVVISLLASFVFLINVVRVLLTKLHPAPNQHSSQAARKATRAALILIPLFGLHFVLIPLRPSPETPGEKAYQVVSALLTSLQGLCVAVLFCFTNHDVMVATRTLLARVFRTNDAIALTGITGGESLMNTRENIV
ncbi:calcitonin gene-related peptide type 1 receptor-like [Plodia interpunctella]|uniref:calcitonin gene-related peptide type 1 receptor-like n=1 Tax=Plodia interpunctella TaxID=58824 RepID=UPI002367FC12|nr:calcitonin gene-related peptide type 1 receptor-like [Plodia interpunctella]XP_053624246.1 calcitonin gene-related peptide type 1 receptor-like [Plodia interpunctella]XP_053624247.1 calcitonin gene-related peptide type 1 receptor-like [Plodia interpunctella]